ncbi:MAG: glycosyltransferase family 2 protein [Erysipelotrichaceae bacterium]|nr:glycosyltransferase family 2 protein [Erysipelotrichaceae bacterium]
MAEDLSIGIVSWHNSEDIRKLVDSIEKYTDPKLKKRICILDNAGEPELFAPLVNQYDDVEYIPSGGNVGFGAGHNLLLNHVDSAYHAIVNPDVLLKEDSFSVLLDFMEKENCGISVPCLVDSQGNRIGAYRKDPDLPSIAARTVGKKLFASRNSENELAGMDYTKPFQVPFAQGSFLVCRTSLLKKLKGFDERFFMYLEDADLCRRANEISKVMYCPDTSVIHNWERGSHKSLKLFGIHLASWFKYFNKWGWFSPSKSVKEIS